MKYFLQMSAPLQGDQPQPVTQAVQGGQHQPQPSGQDNFVQPQPEYQNIFPRQPPTAFPSQSVLQNPFPAPPIVQTSGQMNNQPPASFGAPRPTMQPQPTPSQPPAPGPVMMHPVQETGGQSRYTSMTHRPKNKAKCVKWLTMGSSLILFYACSAVFIQQMR